MLSICPMFETVECLRRVFFLQDPVYYFQQFVCRCHYGSILSLWLRGASIKFWCTWSWIEPHLDVRGYVIIHMRHLNTSWVILQCCIASEDCHTGGTSPAYETRDDALLNLEISPISEKIRSVENGPIHGRVWSSFTSSKSENFSSSESILLISSLSPARTSRYDSFLCFPRLLRNISPFSWTCWLLGPCASWVQTILFLYEVMGCLIWILVRTVLLRSPIIFPGTEDSLTHFFRSNLARTSDSIWSIFILDSAISLIFKGFASFTSNLWDSMKSYRGSWNPVDSKTNLSPFLKTDIKSFNFSKLYSNVIYYNNVFSVQHCTYNYFFVNIHSSILRIITFLTVNSQLKWMVIFPF